MPTIVIIIDNLVSDTTNEQLIPFANIFNKLRDPNKTVSSGSITLDRSSSIVQIGLSYTSLLETMQLEVPSQEGTSQGKIKRIHDVTVRFHKTVGAQIGSDEDDMETLNFRTGNMPMSTAITPFSGDKEIADIRYNDGKEESLPIKNLKIFENNYTFGIGDIIKNKNTSCPHHGSIGIVQKIMQLGADNPGKIVKYRVVNSGPTYKPGDVLAKTIDQLEPMGL